jgi:hypothetical protein
LKGLLLLKGISKNSKSSFSLREKVRMRVLKSSIYNLHPSSLPEGERSEGSGIFRDSLKGISNKPISGRRGSPLLFQLVVFITSKSCVDTYALGEGAF